MATFFVEQFGCRATQADGAAIERQLRERGCVAAAGANTADFVVLNTCTVTAAADSQAREAIRKIHRANPAARIVVTGCYAQRAPEELAEIAGVAWVVGNSHRAEIPGLLCGHAGHADLNESRTAATGADFMSLSHLAGQALSLAHGPAKILTGDIFAERAFRADGAIPAPGDRTRPIFKIQDGCN